MTVTGTVTKAVSNRITSPSTVSPSGLTVDSVIPSSDLAGSVFAGFGTDVFRPDCAYRLIGRKETLKSRNSDSIVLYIKILVWKCAAFGRVVFLLWRIDASEQRRVGEPAIGRRYLVH